MVGRPADPDADTTAGTGYLSTDYTFSASINQQKKGGPLDVSGYSTGGTGANTTTTGSTAQTVTSAPGGVSTSSLTVVSTAAFQEIPGRIYVTVNPGNNLPESPLAVLLPVIGMSTLGGGYLLVRRRRSASA